MQGSHCIGKTEKKAENIPVRENTGNLESLPKHREFFLNIGKTGNFAIQKIKVIAMFAAKFPVFLKN